MIELTKMKTDLHNEVNNLRSLEHYLKQQHFENLWMLSDEAQKDNLRKILKNRDKYRLINWIRKHPSLLLGEKSIRQLRDDAREAYIPNYSRMDKLELLTTLKNYKKTPIKPSDLTNRDMILEITKLSDEMSALFLEAKIKEDYLFVDPAAINFNKKVILEAFDWMHKIRDDEYQKVKRTKMLLPDELWIRYKGWGDFGDHREVVLLNEGLQTLRKAVVNSSRPDLFKKSKVKSFINKLAKEEGC
jgi:hypothetical protein